MTSLDPTEPAHRRRAHPRLTDPAPWSRHSATARLRPPSATDETAAAATPVFVDETGQRRRAGRMLGAAFAVLVLSYLAVVGMTFAGVPLAGSLAPPGVDELSRPATMGEPRTVTSGQERLLPSAAAGSGAATGEGSAPTDTDTAGTSGGPTTAPATATSTTAAPGQATTTTVSGPNSTVPTRTTHTTPDGPPTEPPGKP